MIRLIDGFDLVDFFNAALPYQINSGIFEQGQMLAGQTPGGQSWWIFNTGFGEADFTVILDNQPTWCINLWFRPLTSATDPQTQVWRDVIFYEIGDVLGTTFDLRQRTDGTVQFRSATVPVAIFGPVVVGLWTAVQIKVTATAWTLKVNGVQVGTGVPGLWRQPDRFTFRWDNAAGLNLDHYVLNDGQGVQNNDFLPYPWRVDTAYPLAIVQNGWGVHGQTDALKCVYDRFGFPPSEGEYPDGDLGYLQPTGIDQLALFQMTDLPCVGRVLAATLNVVAKPTASTQQVKLVVEEASLHVLSEPSVVGRSIQVPGSRPELTDYVTYQAITETDTEAGTGWTVGAVNRAAWGVKSDTIGVRVTQIFVSLVSTTNPAVSFDCGQAGNYGF